MTLILCQTKRRMPIAIEAHLVSLISPPCARLIRGAVTAATWRPPNALEVAKFSACIASAVRIDYFLNMSLAEIKTAVDQLSPKELAELAAFIRERDSAAWDREIDEDFSETGRLRRVLDEVRGDARAGRLEELP